MTVLFERNKHIELAVSEKVKPGNEICGDAHVIAHGEGYTVCAVIDGLGSGERANESANAAVNVIKKNHLRSVEEMVAACNEVMRLRRGVVLTVIKINYTERVIKYSNVGNISFIMHHQNGLTERPIPARGYLTGRQLQMTNRTFAYEPNSVFSIYSDGVVEPPPKGQLLKMNNLKVSAHEVFSLLHYVEDDATILIGLLT